MTTLESKTLNFFNRSKNILDLYNELSTLIRYNKSKLFLNIFGLRSPICFDLTKDIFNRSGVIYVDTQNIDHPYWTKSDQIFFRGHHDYLHIVFNQPLTAKGEYEVFKLTLKYLNIDIKSDLAAILFYEIVLQALYKEQFNSFYDQTNYIHLSVDEMMEFIKLLEND